MAKKLFHDMNINYKVVELDMLEYGSQFQDALHKMTGERTVSRPTLELFPHCGWGEERARRPQGSCIDRESKG